MADGAPRNDPGQPNFVWAPVPWDRARPIRLFTNPRTIRQMMGDNRNAALGQYAGLIHGEFAPVDGQPFHGTTDCLMNAIALFQGLKRPLIDRGQDTGIYVYVTTPPVNYEYPAANRSLGEWPQAVAPPANCVFTTYVDIGTGAVDEFRETLEEKGGHDVQGIIHYWEWTLRSPGRSELPADYHERYVKQVW